jgi:hypothetical protein
MVEGSCAISEGSGIASGEPCPLADKVAVEDQNRCRK